MRKRKLTVLLAIACGAAASLLAASSAFAWTVTMTAQPKLKRTYSWTIEKGVSQTALTLKPGETADVTYTVTATPTGSVDSDWGVDGTIQMTRDPKIDVAWLNVVIQLQDIVHDKNPIPAAVSCAPAPFPVDLGLEGLECAYSAALPDATPRNAVMRSQAVDNPDGTPGGFRTAQKEFDFADPAVDLVDESVAVADSMAGDLGTANAADGAKTFTYTKTIGPFTASECGTKTVSNTAMYTTADSGATGSASAAVDVTVTCPPPAQKCPLPSLVWKFAALIGPNAFKTLLPIQLGAVSVTTPMQAMAILWREWTSRNGIDLLAVELLAAKLNAASGRDVSSIAGTMATADAFLAGHSAPSWYSLAGAEKSQVLAWTAALEKYKNSCIPDRGDGDHDWCNRHWDRPDHDWKHWSWKRFDWDD